VELLKARIKIVATFFLWAFSLPSFSQPSIHPAGDGWHIRVDSALSHIKKYDPQKYNLLVEVCNEIEFWSSDFSSNNMLDGVGKIYVSNGDMKIESINNLCCVLVHESLHLLFLKKGIKMSKKEEERLCYLYELELLNKIPGAEPWLIQHTKNKIQQHS
jgi:hypothetical protein